MKREMRKNRDYPKEKYVAPVTGWDIISSAKNTNKISPQKFCSF